MCLIIINSFAIIAGAFNFFPTRGDEGGKAKIQPNSIDKNKLVSKENIT